jgi:hypothetical protein
MDRAIVQVYMIPAHSHRLGSAKAMAVDQHLIAQPAAPTLPGSLDQAIDFLRGEMPATVRSGRSAQHASGEVGDFTPQASR